MARVNLATLGGDGTVGGSGGSPLSPSVALVNQANTFTVEQTIKDVALSGLTGATAASRYVGATASGAPGSGTFAVGDFVIDQTGKIWVCTISGTPGTWTAVGASAVSPIAVSSFTNGWGNFGGADAVAAYYKDGFGIVHLQGTISGGTASTSAFTLPTGYRPAATQRFATIGAGAVVADVIIANDGTVVPNTPSLNSLNGILFVNGA